MGCNVTDNPITQTGIKAEFSHKGIEPRFGRKRVDVKHAWLDPILVAGPWIILPVYLVRRLLKRKR